MSTIVPRPLVRVLVRSKSDEDAVENSLKRFVGSEAEVGSLKGARELSDADTSSGTTQTLRAWS